MQSLTQKFCATRVLGQSGFLTFLLGVCGLWCTGMPLAQGQSAPSSSRGGEAKAVAPAPKQGAAVQARSGEHDKGLNTGITVHGHWVIDVKNPDGKVASHHEFENSLITNPSQELYNYYGGAGNQALINLLGGNTVVTGWRIELGAINNGDVSPCGECAIYTTTTVPSVPGIGVADANQPIQITISGSVPSSQVYQSGTVDAVESDIILASTVTQGLTEPYGFTVATLPAADSGKCGGANQISCAIPVAAGQSISVSVTISFQ